MPDQTFTVQELREYLNHVLVGRLENLVNDDETSVTTKVSIASYEVQIHNEIIRKLSCPTSN